MKQTVQRVGRAAVEPVARAMVVAGVTPNALTLFGLFLSAVAGLLLARGLFVTGGLVLILGSVCDMLDGSVARLTGSSSRFGAFLDSSLDRVAELAVFGGLTWYFVAEEASPVYALLCLLAAGGSFLVSYTRARAEGLGMECKVGLMERPERLVLILAGIFAGLPALRVVLWALTLLVFFTSLQRIVHVQRQTRVS